jgi:S-sulfo-L-cysteine synthase (3-phospho-L-serine-dependent)
VTTVLLVGAGADERVETRARELGLEVRRAAADEELLVDVARSTGARAVLTFDERAVPAVAGAAETLGLAGIGRAAADVSAHKIALRRRLADRGVAQPEFAAVRTLHEARRALETVRLPAVLKPASPSRGRGHFLLRYDDELETHLHAALAESPTQEAILEHYEDGPELLAVAVATAGDVRLLLAADRRRAQEGVLGSVALDVYPTALFGDALAAVEETVGRAAHVLGLRDAVATARLALADDGPRLVGLAPCLADPAAERLAWHALGIDLVEVALRQAVGQAVAERALVPAKQVPVAVQHLTAQPGPLPAGTVRRLGSLDKVAAFPGVVEATVDLAPGATIDPLRLNGGGHGFVVAGGATNLEAAERAEAAARLVDVEVW